MKFCYDLEQTADPVLRAGIIGLWRVLTYRPPQNGVRYSMTDTRIEIEGTGAQLNYVMAQTVGDLSNGLCVPPGYCDDINDERIYATVMAHKAITQHFFAKRGAARSRSAATTIKVQLTETPFSTEESPQFYVLQCTAHQAHDNHPSLDLDKTGEPAPTQSLGVVFNPATSQWNSISVTTTPAQAFAYSFSCLAYAWTIVDGEMVGISLDGPNFTEADDLHRTWIEAPILRAPSIDVAIWAIVGQLDLPPGTYHTISPKGASIFPVQNMDMPDILDLVTRKRISEVRAIEVGKGLDAFETIRRNLQVGRAWYTDIHPTFHSDGKFIGTERTKFVRETLNIIMDTNMDPAELDVMDNFQKVVARLAHYYKDHFGTSLNDGYERARTLINTKFRLATNRPNLLMALSEITTIAGYGFTEPNMKWILARTMTRPAEVRSLLTLATTTRTTPKTNES